MKRMIAALLCLLLVLSLAGCRSGQIMKGTVVEISGNTILVTPAEGSDELRSADKFAISMEKLPGDYEISMGDTVEITYSGGISETYPAGLDGIRDIRVAETNS